MCGIGGIVRFDDRPIAPARLTAMLDQLRLRGPDGDGVALRGRGALVHTRLSILDLPGGAQPMEIPRRGDSPPLAVVFNGEIYNHRDLRRELESLGHRFTTDHSDTEVLLHGYRQWGAELCKRLQGMFAFAIWNPDGSTLFLARDRMGKKPLWHDTLNPGSEFIFGSQPATILAARPERRDPPAIDDAALRQFLRLGYTDEHAIQAGLKEIPPGHSALITPAGEIRLEQYWKPSSVARSPVPADAVDATLQTITDAVASRLEADVPLGCFLSGGIDSSLVAALAQQQLKKRGLTPLLTFCAKMPAGEYDESAHAALVARHIGSRHEELVIDADPGRDFMNDLEMLIQTAGEPLADSSILPTYWISKAARRHVKAVLSGDGGDELFGGYDRYRAMRLLARHRCWLRRIPGSLLADADPRSTRTRLRRLADAARQADPASQYASMVQLFTPDQLRQMNVTTSVRLEGWPADEPDPVPAAMRWDLAHYLPFDLLRKVDRASMAVALEVRCPLLDVRVCELACGLPAEVLMPGGRPKGLLRQVAARLLPAAIVDRPKRGFAIPLGDWFRGPLNQPLADRLFDGSLERLGLAAAPVRVMYDEHVSSRADHTHRLFAMLSLSIWSRWLAAPGRGLCTP